MAEASFVPPTSSDGLTADYNTGFDRSISLMQRASQFRQQQQLQQQQIQANAVLAPLHEATAQAEIVGAGAAIANNTRIQNLRTQAALVSKPAQDEYLAATQIADWNQQEAALGNLQAKYSWMGNVPEYKGFLTTIDTARSNALKRALLDGRIEEAHFRAQTAADARQAAAETYAGSREDVATINANSRETVADTNNQGRLDRAKLPTQHVYEIEKMKALRDQALENGDTAGAAIFEGRMKKINNIAQSSGSAIAAALGGDATPAAPAAAATPAPAAQQSDSPAFTVPGLGGASDTPAAAPAAPVPASKPAAPVKEYKVGGTYKNDKGQFAKYLGNGKWQPIK